MGKKMRNKLFLTLALLLLSGCSSYKSRWNCTVEHGIGCSSIAYADEIAKQEIQLNSNTDETFLNEDFLEDLEVQE